MKKPSITPPVRALKVILTQRGDSCQAEDLYQQLTVEADSAGGGAFIRFATGPEGWSLDAEDLDELAAFFKQMVAQYDKHFEKECGHEQREGRSPEEHERDVQAKF